MLRNYFLTAWRNLVKNRLNAVINVTGLSVAFTCCILLFLMVRYEFSYDGFHTNKNRLYEVYGLSQGPSGEEVGDAQAFPMVSALKTEAPAIAGAAALMSDGNSIRYHGKEVRRRINLVDNDFFSMFSFRILRGNKKSPLAELDQCVIGEQDVKALFGQEDPIGKTVEVKVGGQWKALKVSAVIEDQPENSTLQYGVLTRIEIDPQYAEQKNNWNNQNHPVFAQLAPGATPRQAEAQLREMVKRHNLADNDRLKSMGYRKDANGDYFSLRLAPMTTLHFDGRLAGHNSINKNYLYTMILISIVVMVIACFNFINLNVARSFTRAKEVGIRKTIGAGRRQIYLQLWAESGLLFIVSVVLALLLSALVLRPFNDLFTEKLSLATLSQPGVIAVVLGATLLVSFLAGGYPAWLVSRFNAVEVLKGKISMRRSSLLRSGLITFQFVMAAALICGTIVIYRQFDHLRTAPLGYEQESVISIPVRRPENAPRYLSALRRELASRPEVEAISGSSVNIGIGEDRSQSAQGIGFSYKDKGIYTMMINVDYDFLKVLGMHPIAGRDFGRSYPGDTASNAVTVVVTEMMAKEFGVKDPVGLGFFPDSAGPKWTIVGVVPDFHLYSMNESLHAISMKIAVNSPFQYIFVKVRTNNPMASMHLIESSFKALEPENTIAPSFLSENTQRWYDKESRLSNIFFTAAFIAILLSCMGLFAIVSLIIQQRQKEIGVRKVLGATVGSITGLLSKEFVRLVVVAFLIAMPVAWYFLNRWLDNFLYKTTLSWWIFPLAGLVTLCIALITVTVQTVRAALANPVKSLRTE